MLTLFGVWLRPVERTVRVREVPSSNLGTPTNERRLPAGGSLLFFRLYRFQLERAKIYPQISRIMQIGF